MNKIDHARAAYESCSLQFYENNEFVKTMGLDDNLQSWFNVTVLHLWMYCAQLKTLGPVGRAMCQEMFSTLLLDIEIRLSKAGVRTQIDKIITDLISLYYGQILAYDEGLALGDAVLAGALWKNTLAASDNVSAQDLKRLVEYVRIQLQHLDGKDLTDMNNLVKFRNILNSVE
ncbi:hypothetical protein HDU84_004433 [Entophlyctis sp. JEL0112]|nr:hypothetical protein HDU84_004433 [Entophlyctis sp. JEL0112]